MKLKRININNFKSIKETISIELENNQVTTFIGKNGTGKSNILEALKQCLSKYNYYDRNNKEEIDADFVLELTKEEKVTYFPYLNFTKEEERILVKVNGVNEKDIKIQAPVIKNNIDKLLNELNIIIEEYKKLVDKYMTSLKKIQKEDFSIYYENNNKDNRDFLNTNNIEWMKRDLYINYNKMKDYYKKLYDDDHDFNINHISYYGDTLHLQKYKVKPNEDYNITPIIAKAFGIKKEDFEKANNKIKEEIEKINSKLDYEYNGLIACLKSFQEKSDLISKILDSDERKNYSLNAKVDIVFNSFLVQIKNDVKRECYLIDNENTMLFQKDIYNRNNLTNSFYNTNPILNAIENFLKDLNVYQNDESIFELNKIKDERKKIIQDKINNSFFNEIQFNFDKDEVQRYIIKINSKIELFVIEKNGQMINFNETSLGRRWYLTYKFIKHILKPGDVLLIDEPAAFLHPEAQKEFRDDLNELSKKDIYVFITTHSPYMISSDWNNLYNVSMTSNGTVINKLYNNENISKELISELGITKVNDLLFNLSKTFLFVEGERDKECLNKFSDILGYDLQDYEIFNCHGSTIIGVIYLAIENNIKFKAILDEDNKNKSENFFLNHSGYKEHLDKIQNNNCCIFTGEKNGYNELEGFFSINDQNKCFSYSNKSGKSKVDIEKLREINDFEKETIENFEQLFIKLGVPKIDKN